MSYAELLIKNITAIIRSDSTIAKRVEDITNRVFENEFDLEFGAERQLGRCPFWVVAVTQIDRETFTDVDDMQTSIVVIEIVREMKAVQSWIEFTAMTIEALKAHPNLDKHKPCGCQSDWTYSAGYSVFQRRYQRIRIELTTKQLIPIGEV